MKRDKVEAKDRLLAAGLKYFASKGFDGATVREICDEANSNIAAINYYFGDKQGFYSAVKEHALGIRQKAMDRCWELVETDPWGALRMQIELMLDETFGPFGRKRTSSTRNAPLPFPLLPGRIWN